MIDLRLKHPAILLLLACILFLGGCTLSAQPAVPKPAVAESGNLRSTVIVYLSGQVKQPGTYRMPKGSRMADVIAKAGGFTPQADNSAINPEEIINEVTQIYIPSIGEEKPKPAASAREVPLVAESLPPPKPVKSITIHRPSVSATELERQMVEMINRERAGKGLKELTIDSGLTRSARLKSQDMIDNSYFAHESPKYGTMTELLSSQGITYKLAGENLAIAGTLEQAHRGLINSPGHRMNILNPPYTRIGIGVIQDAHRGLVISQHFTG